MDFIHGLPKFGGYDSCLVVGCGAPRFTCALPCNKKITGEQTVKILVEQWFEHYGVPKEVHSDEDVRIRSDTGWYKRVLDFLNVHVTTGVPYTHASNPLCERQNRVLEQNLRILMKQERIKHFGTSVTLDCPNHELSGEFLNWLYHPRTVPLGGVLRGLLKPLFLRTTRAP